MKLSKFSKAWEIKKGKEYEVVLGGLRLQKILNGSYVLKYESPTGDLYFFTDSKSCNWILEHHPTEYHFYWIHYIQEIEKDLKAHHLQDTSLLRWWLFSFFNAHCMTLRLFPDARIVLHTIAGIKTV